MTTICFVRHGETDQNKLKMIQGQLDYSLNQNGILQANSLGAYLKKNNITYDYIITSPLSRAYETGLILSSYLNINQVYKDNAFIERCFGEFEGMEANDKNFIHIRDDTAKGLEKLQDLKKRVFDGINNIASLYPNKKIMIVSHSHTIKAFTSYIDSKVYNISDRLLNCSMTIFEVDNSNVKIVKFNESVI